ncbi:MAG: amino acid-binding ACT domain-containing protein [Gemmatimonadota bacterium]
MKDLQIRLANRAGALAGMGEALGRAGVSIEGGGVFVVNDVGVAHFLFQDGEAARAALLKAGINVVGMSDVVTYRLDQARPGQLGLVMRRLAQAGVNVEVMYSDHDHRLILVVDDAATARQVLAGA